MPTASVQNKLSIVKSLIEVNELSNDSRVTLHVADGVSHLVNDLKTVLNRAAEAACEHCKRVIEDDPAVDGAMQNVISAAERIKAECDDVIDHSRECINIADMLESSFAVIAANALLDLSNASEFDVVEEYVEEMSPSILRWVGDYPSAKMERLAQSLYDQAEEFMSIYRSLKAKRCECGKKSIDIVIFRHIDEHALPRVKALSYSLKNLESSAQCLKKIYAIARKDVE